MNDPAYFIETFLWIINKERQVVPFLLNPPQKTYLDNRTHFDLILKARKEGFSSLIRALWLHACIFEENTHAVILSHEMESTMRHFDQVRWMLDNMGTDQYKFVVELDKESQKQLVFPQSNSSFWIGTAGSRAFGRGDDITHLHLSEVAHYSDQKILTGVLEACVNKAYRVMETTANGVGETFYRLWQEASDPQNKSPWKPHFFAWFEDPTNEVSIPKGVDIRLTRKEQELKETFKLPAGRLLWYREKYKSLVDKSLMPQEYPSTPQEAFLSSGRHCFTLSKLNEKLDLSRKNMALLIGELLDDGKDIQFRPDSDGPLKVWKAPRLGRQYLISADSGKGVQDGDWSVAHVFDRATWEEVAVWRGRPDPGVFGDILCELGYYYNNAVLTPELNECGWATVERIKSRKYPHLLNTRQIWPESEQKQSWDGFPTNEKTRSLILTALRNCVDDDTVYFNDPVTIGEMMTFIQNPKTLKFEAQIGCWDDCVISAGIGVFCLKFMTVDETYAERVRLTNRGRMRLATKARSDQSVRKSATGYR